MTMHKTILLLPALVAALLAGCGDKTSSSSEAAKPASTNAVPPPPVEPPKTNAWDREPDLKEIRMATGEHGMVVSVNPLATRAGVEVLKKGGNAMDAAVAVGLTLGVVDGHNSGIGGSCFILIRQKNGAYNAIDGRESAPGEATRDMFLRNGKADPELSQTGPLAIATPGVLSAYNYVSKRFGKIPLKDTLLNAAKIAEDGFPVDPHYAGVLKNSAADLAKFPASKKIFLKPDGTPYKVGEVLKQADLAQTYRNVAEQGIGWFYDGPFAVATEKWMKENGGILKAVDFKNYQAVEREPLFSNYRGYTIATMPPPSSGGIHLLQILEMCETQDLYKMRRNGSDVLHYVSEAMKLAFADRAFWLGDPDWVKVPKNLISKQYCRDLASKINMTNALVVPSHGTPSAAETEVYRSLLNKHTTHFAVADSEGNWVSVTTTVNTSFGSKVVIPGTGVVMNNEMDDFSIEPGVANFFGLVGAENNAVGPWKRPLSSMTPTIVSKEGNVCLAVGAAGGPTIISQVALTIINFIDMKMAGGPDVFELDLSLQQALSTPRFHHQWRPDEIRIEDRWVASIQDDLKKKGHKLNVVKNIGACQAIAKNPENGQFIGCPDPRGWGLAEGY